MGQVLLMLLILISSFSLTYCSSMQSTHPRLNGNDTDRQALLAIKDQIRHDPNQVTTSWNDSIHFCQWRGVTCGARHRQRVTKLELDSLNLVGLISPHIGNLSFLRVLNLRNNSFSHQIPAQIGFLHRLKVLNLNNNSLSGTIPTNISNCFNLVHLGLDKNNLVGRIPHQLSFLSKLRILSLQWTNFTGEIPISIGNMSSLEEFIVTGNNFEGSIPRTLCHMKKLTIFAVALNRLSGFIPSCVYNLSSIVVFEVGANQFQGSLPSNIGNDFRNLEQLTIAENEFTGAIPRSISNATKLKWFQGKENELTGEVPSLRSLHNLEYFTVSSNYLGNGKQDDLSFVIELVNATQLTLLELSYNNFGGTFPMSTRNLSSKLVSFIIGGNYLHGEIPVGLGNLFNLDTLGMERNMFRGSIPTDFGKLSNLGILDLSANELSGSIPSSFVNLSILTELYLYTNNLNSSIPSSLGECQSLEILDLSENRFKGKVPPQLLTGLVPLSISLNLSSNRLNGSFPAEIGKLKALGQLDISNNMFSGELSSSIGGCQSLEVLYLQGNFFSGLIPSSMQELKGVRDIDLSHNNFTGNVPHFLEKLNLQRLNLSFNQFWGEVPTGGVFMNVSAVSVAENARLCGGIANLRLPVCKHEGSKGGGLSRGMKLLISLVSGVSLLGVIVLLCVFLLGKKTKEAKLSIMRDSMMQVSYGTLLKATDEFSSANLIGVGAFGSVYRGILSDDGVAVVAVKVFNMLHRGASKSFMAECEALRNIRHRNLVKIITACSSIDFSGNAFKALVYEFMDNGSLEEWLHPSTSTSEEVTEAPKSLSLVQRLDIAIDVASALEYLHNHCETPIVHCDLKPSNVLLDSDLTGHVSDFGISKILKETTMVASGNQSSSIGIRGSVGYVAPEYGTGGEVSIYGDVYSFGILLLEMFTGKRPTDHMFSDGLNLHNYVKRALPERVSQISDSLLLEQGATNVEAAHRRNRRRLTAQKMEECLTLILGLGIACSVESPTNRKGIKHVASELQSIKRTLLR